MIVTRDLPGLLKTYNTIDIRRVNKKMPTLGKYKKEYIYLRGALYIFILNNISEKMFGSLLFESFSKLYVTQDVHYYRYIYWRTQGRVQSFTPPSEYLYFYNLFCVLP